MRTHYRRFFPSCSGCGAVLRAGDCCDRCTANSLGADPPCCEAPGCTREIGRAEKLCGVHVAIAAGEPPRLNDRQLEEAYRRLGDPAKSQLESYSIEVPGIGHVTMMRRRIALDAERFWFEWQAAA